MDLHYCRETLLSAGLAAMLQIRHVYPGSEFFPSRIQDPGSKGSPDPHPHQRIWVFLLKYFFQALWHPGSRSWFFYPSRIPVPGVKKDRIPDSGSGSATLLGFTTFWKDSSGMPYTVPVRLYCAVQAAGVFAVPMVNCRSMQKLFFCPPLFSPLFMTLRCAGLKDRTKHLKLRILLN